MSNEQERRYTVYCHTNKINGKKYVGITSLIPERRWGKDGKGYALGTYFRNAIDKYKWENFEHEILHEGLSKEEAEELEIKYIAEWKLTDSSKGYNLCEGGRTNIPNKEKCEQMSNRVNQYYKEHPEIKEKISESLKKYYSQPEAREEKSKKVKRYHKEHPEARKEHGERMKKYYEEHPELRQKMSDKFKEQWKNSGKLKPIRCIETMKEYDSAAEAGKDTNLNCGTILRAVKGKQDSCGGYHWEYVDERLREEADKCRKERIGMRKHPVKEIYCVELDKKFKSLNETSKKLHVDFYNIKAVCEGKKDSHKGYHFRYVDD